MPQENQKEEKITFNIDKDKNFSEWFTEIIKVAELADVRYNVKGFVVFQPWSVLAMEAMYDLYEGTAKKGPQAHVVSRSNSRKEFLSGKGAR